MRARRVVWQDVGMGDEKPEDLTHKILKQIQEEIAKLAKGLAGVQSRLHDIEELGRNTHAEVVAMAGHLREVDKIADIDRRLSAIEATKGAQ